jgi:hypothetical protein
VEVNMPIANYTTSVRAAKTVGEIQGILVAHGARQILLNYADDGAIESLSFIIKTPYGEMPVRLPVDIPAMVRVLKEQGVDARYRTREHAARVAWRIVKDWVRAQMAILETEMVRMEQIFLPYVVTKDGNTFYDLVVDNKFYLTGGRE